MRTRKTLLALLTASLLAAPACDSEMDDKPEAKVADAAAPAEKPAEKPAAEAPKAEAAAKELDLVADKSSVEFVGAKVTGDHRGKFGAVTGKVEVAGQELKSLTIEVDTTNLVIEPEKLGQHLKSADFFDVEKFPKSSFALTKVEAKAGAEGATHEVTGDLDLRGVKKSVTFPAKVSISDSGVQASASFKINRKDFGINYAGMADDLIKDDVLLDLKLAFGS